MAEKERPTDTGGGAPAPVSNERMDDPVEVPESTPPPTASAPAATPAPVAARGWAPPKRGWPLTLAFAALAVAGAAIALWAWDLPPFSSTQQSTDNAYVRGQTTIISPQLSGYAIEVAVQ